MSWEEIPCNGGNPLPCLSFAAADVAGLLNDDAMLDISVAPGFRADDDPKPLNKLGPVAPVYVAISRVSAATPMGRVVVCGKFFPIANSIKVGCLGTGGAGVVMGPNGFLVPV